MKYLHLHLELNCIHADVDMLVSLAAVLQMVKSFDLVQGVQQTPGEQIDPQHTGWVYTELQAIQLGVQVRGGNWKKGKKARNYKLYLMRPNPIWRLVHNRYVQLCYYIREVIH